MDADGNLYLTGVTNTSEFPLRNPLYPDNHKGYSVTFLSQISPGGELLYSTYIMHGENDTSSVQPKSICLDRCNNVILSGETQFHGYPMVKPIDTSLIRDGNTFISVLNIPENRLVFSSYFNDFPGRGLSYMKASPNGGYLSYLGGARSGLKTYNAYQDSVRGNVDILIGRLHIPTCESVTCAIHAPDTVRITKKRRLVDPSPFEITVDLTNRDQNESSDIEGGQLILPAGVWLDPPSQSPTVGPLHLQPRETKSFTWMLRVDSTMTEPLRRGIMFVATYRMQSRAQSCPAPATTGNATLAIRFVDDTEPRLTCLIDLDDTLRSDAAGKEFTNAQLHYTLRNDDTHPVDISTVRLHLPAGMDIRTSPADTALPAMILQPGIPFTHTWRLDVATKTLPRTAGLSVDAYDTYALSVSQCEKRVYVPDVHTLTCSVTGTDTVWYTASSQSASPDTVRVTLLLENPLDTLQSGIEAELLLPPRSHLALAAGEQSVKGPFFIQREFRRATDWKLVVQPPIDTTYTDTLLFRYRTDLYPVWRFCAFPVRVELREYDLRCAVACPDSLRLTSDGRSYEANPFRTDVTVANRGQAASPAGSVVLALPEYLTASADTTAPLPSIRPSGSEMRSWTLTARTSRFARAATIASVVKQSGGAVVSRCASILHLPAVKKDLLCSITAPDTIVYDLASDTHAPDPFAVLLTLDNTLDTAQQAVDTEIDLTASPHLALAGGDAAAKTVDSIPAHGSAPARWTLEVRSTPASPTVERITSRYRHAGDTAWLTCGKDILIDGGERTVSASCSTAGHDSLFADVRYERIIPQPVQLQYTITNTGNAPLPSCDVAIILPPEYTLADPGDSIQSYGTITPGGSVSREWLFTAAEDRVAPGRSVIRWRRECPGLGTDSSCTRDLVLVPSSPAGIVFSPWMLRFSAERDASLPAPKSVELWTGGRQAMPWQLQSGTPWLEYQPGTGDARRTLVIGPNTTSLDPDVHAGTIGVVSGYWVAPREIRVAYEITRVSAMERPSVAETIRLGQSYPNPARTTASMEISIPDRGYVRLAVTDILGRWVTTVCEGDLPPGSHIVRHDVSHLSPGLYLCTLSAMGRRTSRVMVVK
jgi:hypothetical protein